MNTTPRRPWQFSMRTLVLLPLYSILLVGGALALFGRDEKVALGVGHTDVRFRFVVLDTATSSPVPGALVRIYDSDTPGETAERAETSTLGEAEITRGFMVYVRGPSSKKRASAIVHFVPLRFEVSAPGYKVARYWLSQFAGRSHDLEVSKPSPVAVVRLTRDDSGEERPPVPCRRGPQ